MVLTTTQYEIKNMDIYVIVNYFEADADITNYNAHRTLESAKKEVEAEIIEEAEMDEIDPSEILTDWVDHENYSEMVFNEESKYVINKKELV